MNVLVVYAHPNPESFNATIYKLVRSELQACGHQIQCLDLYKEAFESCMSQQEWVVYMTKDNTDDKNVYIDQLKWAEALVLIYPTWWMGQPAIMKGWFDRIWLPGIAASFGPEGVQPGLTNIKKIMVITTQGSSRWRMMLIGNPPKKMMKLMLKACTKSPVFKWVALNSMDKITAPELSAFLKKVRGKIRAF